MTKDTLAQIETAKFNCRIEGMKAENASREYCGTQIVYYEDSFMCAMSDFETAIRKIQDKAGN